jgi:hypothetical protein
VLNRLGGELHNDAEPPPAPVSLPSLKFLREPWVDDHDEAERARSLPGLLSTVPFAQASPPCNQLPKAAVSKTIAASEGAYW